METPSNASGIFSEDPQEVRYIYDTQDEEEIDSENSTPAPEEETDLLTLHQKQINYLIQMKINMGKK